MSFLKPSSRKESHQHCQESEGECQYSDTESGQKLLAIYDEVLSILGKIINNPTP
jgi:hypothetical protein